MAPPLCAMAALVVNAKAANVNAATMNLRMFLVMVPYLPLKIVSRCFDETLPKEDQPVVIKV
jgi:hypothetical protein